eukprot:GHUV01018979.1.p1 GENE.GHUV01018979.1~~GHUV01018979.1.p1  ORF type:complete len:166 (-),score=30.37 GHUV01018979.1:3950-4447(-)
MTDDSDRGFRLVTLPKTAAPPVSMHRSHAHKQAPQTPVVVLCVHLLADAHKTGVAQEAVKQTAKVGTSMSTQEARQILNVQQDASLVDVAKVYPAAAAVAVTGELSHTGGMVISARQNSAWGFTTAVVQVQFTGVSGYVVVLLRYGRLLWAAYTCLLAHIICSYK